MAKKLKVLVGCEFTDTVASAFRRLGHNAYSCDFYPTEGDDRYHLNCDVRDVLNAGWDLAIFHPPCTYLSVSGARWFRNPGRRKLQKEAILFVAELFSAPIEKICIENPVGVLSTQWRQPCQYIQPWQFGHGEVKNTCLWLKGLPELEPTEVVKGRQPRVHHMSPGQNRGRERSRFYTGIAEAMAEQWGGVAW